MKLKSFRIYNYRSIIDSGLCTLSGDDNITILAGQNESGKSSILRALRDFENDNFDQEALRGDGSKPFIICTYQINPQSFEGITASSPIINTLYNRNEVTLIKTIDSENKTKLIIESELASVLKSYIEGEIFFEHNLAPNSNNKQIESLVKQKMESLAIEVFNVTPIVILFDDMCDLLPNEILLSDIISNNDNAVGISAVRNIQTILNADFSEFENLADEKKESKQSEYLELISDDFNETWKQRIGEGNGSKIHIKHNRNLQGKSYLKFYIETKKGEFLTLNNRSQGFKWFLSLFLQLKAENFNENKLIILFDEPGLYLHSRAQIDMLNFFEELANKHQIIYSTHSPHLINTEKLHRLRLILNTGASGTTIEKITSKKISNQKDALKPIIDAIGLEIATSFTPTTYNNVILEGISDFYYFTAMRKILNQKTNYSFLPSMGASNCHLLMELCIGWGLNWVIIFDDKGAIKDFNKIKKQFFENDENEASTKMFKLKNCDGIEDMFDLSDLQQVIPNEDLETHDNNGQLVKQFGGKELFARLFLEKAQSGVITKASISEKTIENFKLAFEFIDNCFSEN